MMLRRYSANDKPALSDGQVCNPSPSVQEYQSVFKHFKSSNPTASTGFLHQQTLARILQLQDERTREKEREEHEQTLPNVKNTVNKLFSSFDQGARLSVRHLQDMHNEAWPTHDEACPTPNEAWPTIMNTSKPFNFLDHSANSRRSSLPSRSLRRTASCAHRPSLLSRVSSSRLSNTEPSSRRTALSKHHPSLLSRVSSSRCSTTELSTVHSSTEVHVDNAAFGGLKMGNLAPKKSAGNLSACTYGQSIAGEENYFDERSNISDISGMCMEDDWNCTLERSSQDKPKVTELHQHKSEDQPAGNSQSIEVVKIHCCDMSTSPPEVRDEILSKSLNALGMMNYSDLDSLGKSEHSHLSISSVKSCENDEMIVGFRDQRRRLNNNGTGLMHGDELIVDFVPNRKLGLV